MFDYESMLDRALKFFPTWSDIRKRPYKSIGGKLISSITEKSITIEDAIQEYIDYYFLNKYEGKEQDIIAFAYRANIGKINNINNIEVKYNDQIYAINTDIESFSNDINSIYYENGYVYIREELYSDEKIYIIYENNILDYVLEKYHVWNIYDEFACFIGIERHENESNIDLYNRMLYFNKNKPNSSELGLKNAIISELMIYEPDIKLENIKIEKVNETNLRKPYEDYNELLDKLNEMNRDVYRWKRWDLDEWVYEFKTIEYLPYKWNETLTKWQNGIGYDDDLKVIVSNDTNVTDANITLYEKSQERLLSYIHNNNIYKSIGFTLKSYKDILNSIPVSYKIQASPMKKINPEEFTMNIYENTYVDEKVSIESLFSFGNDIVKIDNSIISDIYPYRLQFIPKDGNNIEIKKCKVLYKKNGQVEYEQNLLSPANNFVINSLGYLVNTSTKKSIKNLSKLNSFYGLINLDKGDGFTLSNNIVQGSGSIIINGLGGNILNYSIECDMSELPKQYIEYNSSDCIWNNGNKQLTLINNNKTKTVEINIIANKLSFDILCNNSVLVYIYNKDTDNWNPEEVIGPNATWSSKETKEPREIKIKIESNSKDNIILGNFKYSKYEIKFETEKNKIINKDGKYILPNLIENILYFKIISYSGSSPIIKGIYIGDDISNLSYTSDIFEYKNDHTRILEIDSNCTVNLIKMNPISYNTIDIIKDYNAYTSYEAISDNAWIRLDLSDYDIIDNIYTSNGSIEMIEESGIIYYNLKLSNKESVSYIRVIGNKNLQKEVLSLYDMILVYNPSFDISKDIVYCSRLANGLIISTNGENNYIDILQLDSNLFAGLDILKYEFDSIPDDLNIIWGISSTEKKYGYSYSGDFEYISFYPADSEIHTALNSYDLFINEVKDIKVVNNFNPSLNIDDLIYCTVEPFDNQNDIDIKFYNELTESNISFNKLKKWSVGLKNLYIKCDLDLLNSAIYNVSETYVLDEVKLNQSIKIKDTYNDNTIQTNKCVIEVPDDMQVIYQYYDGTSNTEDLLIKETIEIQNDGFKKLEYSNIDKIFYIGTNMGGSAINQEQSFTDYSLLKDEGILIWNNLKNHIGKRLYITYTIKKANYILLSDEYLYKTISYNINAYKELSKYHIENMKDGDSYDLNKLDKFKDSDLVYVSCSEPTFEGIMVDDKIKFNKYSNENNILVKTGYYYINGKEYYLFSNKEILELDTNNNMYSENIDIEDGKILTYKTTDNRLKNTSMIQKGINNLFNFDYRDTLVKGVSNFSKYTSCESYNNWHTSGMKISLTDEYKNIGCNDIALLFSDSKDWGYSFIDITDYLYDDKTSYISFISSGVKVFIGKEKKYLNIDLPESFNIEIIDEITSNVNLKSYSLDKNFKDKYYLIVRGDGVLDDIIITDNILDIYSSHNKNIDILGFELNDYKSEGDVYRLEISDNDNYSSYCAGICSDGLIRTTSRLNWNITKIKEYKTREDWLNSELNNIIVNDTYIQSIDREGSVFIEEPIFIENPYTVNRLIIKVNDINIEQMKDIKIYIYTSNERNGQYRLYTFFNSNYGFVYGDYISRYIKIKLEIPKNKVVDNMVIYAEYKSEEPNIITAETSNTGYIISNIFDSQECLRYRINDINIENISDINDIDIYIRSAGNNINVWTNWKNLDLESNNSLIFNNARFFQLKILLKSKYAQLKFNYIDLEVI